MTSRRESLTSLREKDRSNLTTMKFFVATLQNSIEKPRNERDYFIWGVLLTTLEY